MSDFIGAGERTVETIAKFFFTHPYQVNAQTKLEVLIKNPEEFKVLSDVYKKHKADFGIFHNSIPQPEGGWTADYVGVIRVQGKDHTSGKTGQQHQIKSLKDKNLKKIFEDNFLWVIDILIDECPNIFKERLNWNAVIEFAEMAKMTNKHNKIKMTFPGIEL